MEVKQIELIGGHPTLDFINTVEGRGSGEVLNYLSDFEKLAKWSERAGLISPARAKTIIRVAQSDPESAARNWQVAMDLRDSLDRIFRALSSGARPPEEVMTGLNKLLRAALGGRELALHETGTLQWTWRQNVCVLESLVFDIVLNAVSLMTDEKTIARIKICANGPCDWVFLDTTKNGKRRWCRMGVCGNVTKVRRFRDRQRSVDT